MEGLSGVSKISRLHEASFRESSANASDEGLIDVRLSAASKMNGRLAWVISQAEGRC